MKELVDVIRTILLFAKWLIIALIFVCLWVWAVQATHAQGLPLVKASHDSFVSYYDVQTHNPALVVYQLEYSHFAGVLKQSGRHFKMDTQLPRPRVKDGDYSNSGFVRGHLCSAADRDSKKSWLKETYLTSNLVPMTMVCNSGRWKAIEDSCRFLAILGHRLRVGRLPLYDNLQNVLHTGVATKFDIEIPDGFACVAMCLDCDLRYFDWCPNLGCHEVDFVLQNFAERKNSVIRQNPVSPYDDEKDIPTGSCRVIQFRNDPRVSMLLTNIFGSWSRAEYETITH